MMPARRPRGSDAAGRTSPRTSPALARSRGSFFARIFVLAFFVEGAVAPIADWCDDTSLGCCECMCDDSSVDPPAYVSALHNTASAAESWCNTDAGSVCRDLQSYPGDFPNLEEFRNTCGGNTVSSRWVPASSSCTTSQYLKDGSCVACPPSAGADSSHPSATSTGGSATSCTCPENYYAYAGMYAPSTYNWACAECGVGSGFIKNGSAIPTANGASDTCDCPAGYYLDNTGLNCNECPAGQTSAGGRVTECTSRATGGTVTTVGEYTIHTFTSTGTFTVIDSTLTEVEVLVVGGGGSGGGPGNTPASGGGGGGGVLTASRSIDVQSYIVTVGDGAGTYDDGGYSAFDDMVVFGGKGIVSGYDGGASGYCTLGSWLCNGVDYGDASGNLEAQRAGGVGSSEYCGGGAGAGGVGQDESSPNGGKGGDGILSSISGTATYYGGGGGGGSSYSSGGSGGLGGGGNGADGPAVWPKSGEPNTGGGGGGNGGSSSFFAEGGSGIVIVRYKAAASSEQSCGTNYYYDGSDCVACPTGSTRMPETANQCLCPENHHRSVDGGVYSCAACAQGSTRLPGDTVPGGDATTCTSSVSPPPPPPSAQALEKVAEETRDSILADFSDDERLKAKVKLLADAAIAGAKVQRLTARMSAADEDTACSNAFSGAGMSSGDGACVATAASSGKRRRLSSTTYDVELMFSSATVSDDALTTAADALKTADGVTSVASQASVDPITELKTVPGVDTSKLQTFDTQAQAAVAAAASTPPPSIPPPTPPPPPKPNLVLDDDDAAVGLRGGLVACVAAMLVLVLVV